MNFIDPHLYGRWSSECKYKHILICHSRWARAYRYVFGRLPFSTGLTGYSLFDRIFDWLTGECL